MTKILQLGINPLDVSSSSTFKSLEEASAAYNKLVERVNRVLIRVLEDNRQRVELGLSDGTRDLSIASIDLSNQSGFFAYSSNNQSINSNSRTTIIFTTESYDNLGEYDTATGIFTAEEAGTYIATASTLSESVAWPAGEYWITILSKNDSTSAGSVWHQRSIAWAAKTDYFSSSVTAIMKLAAGDTLKCKVVHSQGGAVKIYDTAGDYNYFMAHKLS